MIRDAVGTVVALLGGLAIAFAALLAEEPGLLELGADRATWSPDTGDLDGPLDSGVVAR